MNIAVFEGILLFLLNKCNIAVFPIKCLIYIPIFCEGLLLGECHFVSPYVLAPLGAEWYRQTYTQTGV